MSSHQSCSVCNNSCTYASLTTLCEFCLKHDCTCYHEYDDDELCSNIASRTIKACPDCLRKPLSEVGVKTYTFQCFRHGGNGMNSLNIVVYASFLKGTLTMHIHYYDDNTWNDPLEFTLPEFIDFWKTFASNKERLQFPFGVSYPIYNPEIHSTSRPTLCYDLDDDMFPAVEDLIDKLS